MRGDDQEESYGESLSKSAAAGAGDALQWRIIGHPFSTTSEDRLIELSKTDSSVKNQLQLFRASIQWTEIPCVWEGVCEHCRCTAEDWIDWTGLMGRPMGMNLLKAGHSLTVWNRTASRARRAGGGGRNVGENTARSGGSKRCADDASSATRQRWNRCCGDTKGKRMARWAG